MCSVDWYECCESSATAAAGFDCIVDVFVGEGNVGLPSIDCFDSVDFRFHDFCFRACPEVIFVGNVLFVVLVLCDSLIPITVNVVVSDVERSRDYWFCGFGVVVSFGSVVGFG